MFKKIVTTLFIAYAGLQASPVPQELKYEIDINKKFKGVLLFNNEGKSSKVEYFNITSRDKIPFYAPSKEFSFTSLNKSPTLKSLEVNAYKRHMVYDVAALSEDEIEEADINSADIDDSAIIYNKEDLPSEVLEKRNIHTIESLILSIFQTKKISTDAFYLYEPQKKMLLKVKFSKEKNERIKLGELSCDTQTYVLSIAGRDKRLIRVYINKYPFKIESFKKKWSFTLTGSGESQNISISNKEIAFKVFKDEVLDLYKDFGIEILSQKVETDIFNKKYLTKFHVWKKLSEKEIKASLRKYTNRNSSMQYTKSKKDAFVFSVDNDDVMNLLEKKYDVEDDKYIWKKEPMSIKIAVLKKYIKNRDEPEDYEELLEEYYKGKYKEVKISKVKEVENKFAKKSTTLKYTLASLREINNDIIYSFVVKAMQKEYPKNRFSSNLQFEKLDDKWSLFISKKAVKNFACKNAIPYVQSEFKDGMCQKIAQKVNREEDAQNLVTKFINRNYKDVSVLGTEINYNNDDVSFEYLKLSKKVENECK